MHRLPKLGKVRIRRRSGNPYAHCKPKQAVFTRRGEKWYCTVLSAVPEPAKNRNGQTIGVDMNVRQIATSDDEQRQERAVSGGVDMNVRQIATSDS